MQVSLMDYKMNQYCYFIPNFIVFTSLQNEMKPKEMKKTCTSKREQNESIKMRQMVLMGILLHNFNYSFILSKPQKRSYKGTEYYPILKIYNENGEEIYDKDTLFEDDDRNKNEKAKRYAIELMKDEIKKHNYDVEERYTNSTKIQTSGMMIRLSKIFSLKYDGKFFEMSRLEETMGIDIHKRIENFFRECLQNEIHLVHCTKQYTTISDIPVYSLLYDTNQLIELNYVELIHTK